jgi:hypothetical protein
MHVNEALCSTVSRCISKQVSKQMASDIDCQLITDRPVGKPANLAPNWCNLCANHADSRRVVSVRRQRPTRDLAHPFRASVGGIKTDQSRSAIPPRDHVEGASDGLDTRLSH